jgi:hypothetical protein
MTPSPTCQRRPRGVLKAFGYFRVTVLALLGLLITLLITSTSRDRTVPRLSVHFTGEITSGLHRNPFGHFVLSNEWNRPLEWTREGVEAPQDRDIAFGASVDSNIPMGTLQPGTSTNLPILVPHTKGVPFRVMIGYAYPPRTLDRIRSRLPNSLPIIDRLWPRSNLRRTFTSEWFYATADYTR